MGLQALGIMRGSVMEKVKNQKSIMDMRQLLIVSAILMISVMVIVISYFVMASRYTKSEQNRTISQSLSAASVQYESQIQQSIQWGELMAKLVISSEDRQGTGNIKFLENVVETDFILEACISDPNGNAVNSKGKKISIKDFSFQQEIMRTAQSVVSGLLGDVLEGKKVIVVSSPIIKSGKLLGAIHIAYDTSYFWRGVQNVESSNEVCRLLLDKDGEIIQIYNETLINSHEGENFYDNLENARFEEGNVSKIKNDIYGNKSSTAACTINGEDLIIGYTPVSIKGSYLVSVYSYDYIKGTEDKLNKITRSLVYKIFFAMFLYVVVLVTLDYYTKMRDEKKSRELQKLVEIDGLTTVYNKVATERYIREYIEADVENRQGVLFIIDVDNFKKINDTKGHVFGDEVLKALGSGLKTEFKVTDILGRIGGDEFVVFLKDIESFESAKEEGERLVRFFRQLRPGEYVKYKVSASIGGAVFPEDAVTYEALYRAADKALYKAKKRGKDQYAFFRELKNEEQQEEN